MSKGSKRRPTEVSEEEVLNNWNLIFKKPPNDNRDNDNCVDTPVGGVIHTDESEIK